MSTGIFVYDARFTLIWTYAHHVNMNSRLATRAQYQGMFNEAREQSAKALSEGQLSKATTTTAPSQPVPNNPSAGEQQLSTQSTPSTVATPQLPPQATPDIAASQPINRLTWILPWEEVPSDHPCADRAQLFWRTYLKHNDLRKVDWLCAWEHQVPLRADAKSIKTKLVTIDLIAPQGQQSDLDISHSLEIFAYPFGASIAITIRLRSVKGVSLKTLVDTAAHIRTASYSVTWIPNKVTTELSLDSLAAQVLERTIADIRETQQPKALEGRFRQVLRRIVTRFRQRHAAQPPASDASAGDNNEPFLAPPWSVAAIADARDADPNQPIRLGSRIHRALGGLCLLHPNWHNQAYSDLPVQLVDYHSPRSTTKKVVDIKRKNLAVGDNVYVNEHGRVIWLPSHFTVNTPHMRKTHKIGHYYRNMVLATLQTASLIDLAKRGAYALHKNRSQQLSMSESDRVKRAAELLGRLYSGNSTYSSGVLHHQIAPSAKAINKIRQQLLGWSALH